MRIVLDTNVLVRTNARAIGPAHELLLEILAGDHVILLSPFLAEEVKRVLGYPRVRALWKLTDSDIWEHMKLLGANAELVYPLGVAPSIAAEPEDDAVIHTAVTGGAEVLCTLDRHFYSERVLDYCKRKGIEVMDDVALLQMLRFAR